MLPIVDDESWSRATGYTRSPIRASAVAMRSGENNSGPFGNQDRTREQTPFLDKSRPGTLVVALSLIALAGIMYAPVLVSLARQWWDDPNYGHGFFVPIFAAYILWRDRNRWGTVPRRANNSGLSIMLFAVGLLILGTLGAELFTTRMSLLFLIAGTTVFLAGWQALRSVAFPLGYLVFMIPLPAIVYYQLTFPLQLLASRLGANGLIALGVHTIRQGNILILPNCTLEVVEACSGVRSLLSLLAAVVAYGYLAEPSIWKRCVLVVSTIPIVIATNGLRLVATGVLSFFFGPGVDSGIIHMVLGLAFFVLAFLSVLLIHELLRRLSSQQTPTPEHA